VAGCSHFGFWYRLLDHPEGPSYTSQYCPNKIKFGTFFNNSVHSSGRSFFHIIEKLKKLKSKNRLNNK